MIIYSINSLFLLDSKRSSHYINVCFFFSVIYSTSSMESRIFFISSWSDNVQLTILPSDFVRTNASSVLSFLPSTRITLVPYLASVTPACFTTAFAKSSKDMSESLTTTKARADLPFVTYTPWEISVAVQPGRGFMVNLAKSGP